MNLSNKTVAQFFKDKKIHNHYLLNIEIRKWTEKDIKLWTSLNDPVKVVIQKNNFVKQSKPVMRLSDGKIYPKMKYCMLENGINHYTLTKLASNNIDYKFIK